MTATWKHRVLWWAAERFEAAARWCNRRSTGILYRKGAR